MAVGVPLPLGVTVSVEPRLPLAQTLVILLVLKEGAFGAPASVTVAVAALEATLLQLSADTLTEPEAVPQYAVIVVDVVVVAEPTFAPPSIR